MCETTEVICNELPPNSKKLSFTPIFSIPSTTFHISESICSISLRGSINKAVDCSQIGSGRAFRSILPFDEIGNCSIGMMYAGII